MQDALQVRMKQSISNVNPGGFGHALLKLEQEGYLEAGDLARILRSNPGLPLLPELSDYMAEFVVGNIKQKRGPRNPYAVAEEFENFDADERYHRLFRIYKYLDMRWRRSLKARREIPPRAVLTPHEKAIKATTKWINCQRAARGQRGITARSLANRLSKHRKAIVQCSSSMKPSPYAHYFDEN